MRLISYSKHSCKVLPPFLILDLPRNRLHRVRDLPFLKIEGTQEYRLASLSPAKVAENRDRLSRYRVSPDVRHGGAVGAEMVRVRLLFVWLTAELQFT
jgi:hypothetical protein